jgi:hypothetical protein
VASGRCTSEPLLVEIAIGMKPTDATSAVINTGRNRVSVAGGELLRPVPFLRREAG